MARNLHNAISCQRTIGPDKKTSLTIYPFGGDRYPISHLLLPVRIGARAAAAGGFGHSAPRRAPARIRLSVADAVAEVGPETDGALERQIDLLRGIPGPAAVGTLGKLKASPAVAGEP